MAPVLSSHSDRAALEKVSLWREQIASRYTLDRRRSDVCRREARSDRIL